MRETIKARFNPNDLPTWAQAFPLVVRRCRRNLAFRIDVCRAETLQIRHCLIEEAQRIDAEECNR